MIESTFLTNRKLDSEAVVPTDELAKAYGLTQDQQAPPSGKPASGVMPSGGQGKPDVQGQLEDPVKGFAKGAAATAENAVNAVVDTANFALDGINQFDNWLMEKGITKEDFLNDNYKIPNVEFVDRKQITDGQQLGYAIGQTMAQVATFSGVAMKTGSMLKGIAAGGGVAATVQDPQGPRLSDSLKDTPLIGPLAELLASNPEDSNIVGRVKNGIEGMVLDTALAGAFVTTMAGYRGYRKMAAGAGKMADEASAAAKAAPGPEAAAASPDMQSMPINNVDNPVGTGGNPDAATLSEMDAKRIAKTEEKWIKTPAGTPEGRAAFDANQRAIDVAASDPASYGGDLEKLFAIDVNFPEGYQSPLAGKSPDALLSDIRGMKETGLADATTNPQPLADMNPDTAAFAKVGETQPGAQRLRFTPSTQDEISVRGAEIYNDKAKMESLYQRPANAAYTSEEIMALGFNLVDRSQTLANTARQIEEFAAQGREIPESLLAQFRQVRDEVPYLNDVYEGAVSGTAQALAVKSYNFGNAMTPDVMKEYLALAGGSGSIQDEARMLSTLVSKRGDTAVGEVIDEMKRKATWPEALMEVTVRNLISGPMTTVKTGASNVAQQTTRAVERMLAPTVAAKRGDSAMSQQLKIAGTAANKEFLNAMGAEFSSGLHVFYDSLVSFFEDAAKQGPVQALKMMDRKLGKGFRFDYRPPAMDSEALGIKNRVAAGAVDIWGSTSRLMSSGMGAVDRFSDAVAHRAEGTFQAYLLGQQKGLQGEELAKFADNLVSTAPKMPEVPTVRTAEAQRQFNEQMAAYKEHKDFYNKVLDYREKVKFNNTPTTGIGADVYNAVQTRVGFGDTAGVPVLRVLSPFVRNNVNMAQQGFDAVPVLRGLSPRNQAILQAGGAEADLLKSRFKIMNTLMMGGAAAAVTGAASGMGSLNPDVRRNQRERGFVAHSIGNYAEFEKYGVAGEIMAMGADLGKLGQYVGTGIVDDKFEADYSDALQYFAATLADRVVIDDVIADFWAGAKSQDMRLLKQSLYQQGKSMAVGGLVPGMQFMNFIRQQTDPFKRQTVLADKDKSVFNEVLLDLQNRIPGMSEGVPYALDTLGYPIETTKGLVRLTTDFDDDLIEKNKVLKGLVQLGMSGALVNPHPRPGEDSLVIRPMQKSIRFNNIPEEIALSPEQYNDLVLLSLGKDSPTASGNVEKQIGGILESNKPDEIKKIMIKSLVREGRRYAKAGLMQKYPDLLQRYRELVQQRQGALRGDATDFMEDDE